jgi:hypothetical protein
MKNFLLSASATASLVLAAAFGAATPASAMSANEFCEANANFGFATNGECLHFVNKDLIVDACKNLLAVDPVLYESFYGSTRLGACVSQTRHLLKSL